MRMSGVKRLSPEWMEIWLRFPFYEEKCKKHSKYNTIFCTVCMEEPFCETCWKEKEKEHQGHPILQVSRASRRPSIRIDAIRQCWDISDIQQYTINHKRVVYLQPNSRDAVDRKQNGTKCETCQGKLINEEYDFCSIACKETMDMGNSMRTQKNAPLNTGWSGCSTVPRKRRKGIPRRAPLK